MKETVDLVTFTEETINGKLIFCAVSDKKMFKVTEPTKASVNAQRSFTCSKLTIEKLEQGVKYVQS